MPAEPAAGKAEIEQLMREGKLRQATSADFERWQRFARAQGIAGTHPRIDAAPGYLSMSQMYVVTAPMTFPADLYGAHSVAFIVLPGVPHPAGDPGHSLVLSMNP